MTTRADEFFNNIAPENADVFLGDNAVTEKHMALLNNAGEFGIEQLDMFDKLDIALYSADMYAWEADFNTKTVTRTNLPSGKGTSLKFDEFFTLINEHDAKTFRDIFIFDEKQKRRTVDIDIRIKSGDSERWFKVKGAVYRFKKDYLYAAGVAYDIENTKTHLERLEYLKTHDFLTGLDNLGAFDRLSESGNCQYPCSLIIACIENLREINDSLGYVAGNDLIKNVADVLKECFSDSDFTVRIGGGEFCVIFSGKDALEIEMKIKEANMMIHRMYLNLIKTEVSFSYAISNDQNELFSLYRQAAVRLQKSRDLKRILSDDSVVDKLNEIISIKAGWGKRDKRLQSLAALIGGELDCSDEQINEIKALAKIADLGNIGIDNELLLNRGELNDEDKLEYGKHVEIGRSLIAGIGELADMEGLYLDIYKRYDEWKDGIALSGRIVAGALAFDDISLVSKSAKLKNIVSSIAAQKGTKYCPKVVDAIIQIAKKHLVVA